jgi:NADPH:quinone reductase-like Zn-dependent oxidoreductase
LKGLWVPLPSWFKQHFSHRLLIEETEKAYSMKAIILKEAGEADQLRIQEIDKPSIQKNEVLVKTRAIGINPVDIKTRNGKAQYGLISKEQSAILGWDISGEVVAVGDAVKKFKQGDTVFGMVNFPGHGKAYAEYVAAPEEHLALKPAVISHQEAAAASLAALTAWQVLVHEAGLRKGQKLLIHAAGGGVGHFAIQIAKHLGAHVTGTASGAKSAFLQELGINEHIDYTQKDFEVHGRIFDLVVDPLGGETTRKSLNVVKAGGKLISIVGGVKDELQARALEQDIQATNYLVHSSGSDMEALAELMKSGALKAAVSHAFNFEDIAEAHRQIETGKTRGKVVINIA